MTENNQAETPAVEDLAKEGAQASSAERPYRKTLRGYVVSDKMDKTIVVEVEERVKHARYGKVTTKTSKFKETRPLSASKRWRLVEILERAK